MHFAITRCSCKAFSELHAKATFYDSTEGDQCQGAYHTWCILFTLDKDAKLLINSSDGYGHGCHYKLVSINVVAPAWRCCRE